MTHYSTPVFPLQLQNSYNCLSQISPLEQNIWTALYFFAPLGYHVFYLGPPVCFQDLHPLYAPLINFKKISIRF